MARKHFNGKTQRGEEILSNRDRAKMHDLYRKHGVSVDFIAERFSMDVNAVVEILRKPAPAVKDQWRVRWDDEKGDSHNRVFHTFEAAKLFASRLHKVEWKKIEKT